MPAFKDLPRKQQLTILIGTPAAIALLLGYFSWKSLALLGPDPKLPGALQRRMVKLGADGQPDPDALAMPSIFEEIEATEKQIEETRAKRAQGPAIQRQRAALEKDIKIAEQRLPDQLEKAKLREDIEAMAKAVPPDIGLVKFVSVSIQEGQSTGRAKGDYQTVVYQTSIQGDLNGIIKFIDSIEKYERFMTVESFSISPGAITTDAATRKMVPGLHNVALRLVTYVYNKGGK